MSIDQIIFFAALTAFYIAYLAKMIELKRQGVQGNILGKGSKPKRVILVERSIQAITYTGAAVQYASVIAPGWMGTKMGITTLWAVGLGLACAGVGLFACAVVSMKSNWRAGYSEDQNTSLVTGGIYSISRNPAFAGFDLLYMGCALAYPNPLSILWCIAAASVFHLQIMSEEQYLASAFGEQYKGYTQRVRRYLGRKNPSVG